MYENGINDLNKFENKILNGMVYAIIPARGGSKTIPKKNIKLLAGKPLIFYSIEHARQTQNVDKVFVSSDDDQILKIANQFGANTIKRPDYLSGDITQADTAIVHALLDIFKSEKAIPQYVLMLQPTSPLRNINNIDNAIKAVQSKKFSSSISAARTHHLFWTKEKNNEEWTSNYGTKRPRRQDLEQFTEDGSIYVFDSLKFLKSGKRIISPVHIEEIDQQYSYEIDTLTDWDFLESFMERLQNN